MSFNDQNVRLIYDCGSLQTKLLEYYIDTIDTSIETILVLSHFHRDHINCVPYLIEHFKKKKAKKNLKALYIPRYNPDIIRLFAMSITATGTSETWESDDALIDFIENMDSADSFGTTVYVHPPDNENQSGRNRIRQLSYDECKKIISFPVGDACKITWQMKFWVDCDICSLIKKDNLDQLKNYELSDFKDKSKSKEIKSTYRSIIRNLKRDFNETSMIMASFIGSDSDGKQFVFLHEYKILEKLNNIGFVCTGDYSFTSKERAKEINSHYGAEQYKLCGMVVPHHGGENACNFMPFDFIKTACAQNAKYNKYGHPSSKTIKNLETWGINFINIQDQIHS